jgi:hypothetical protein
MKRANYAPFQSPLRVYSFWLKQGIHLFSFWNYIRGRYIAADWIYQRGFFWVEFGRWEFLPFNFLTLIALWTARRAGAIQSAKKIALVSQIARDSKNNLFPWTMDTKMVDFSCPPILRQLWTLSEENPILKSTHRTTHRTYISFQLCRYVLGGVKSTHIKSGSSQVYRFLFSSVWWNYCHLEQRYSKLTLIFEIVTLKLYLQSDLLDHPLTSNVQRAG